MIRDRIRGQESKVRAVSSVSATVQGQGQGQDQESKVMAISRDKLQD